MKNKMLQLASLAVAVALCLFLVGTAQAQCPNCAQAAPQPGVSVQVDPSGVQVRAGRDARALPPQVVVAQNGNGNGDEICLTPEQLENLYNVYFNTHYRPAFRLFAFRPVKYVPVRVNSPRQQVWRRYQLEILKQRRGVMGY